MHRLLFRLAAAAALLAAPARADDWPQWMGPNRDGVWKETGVVEKFPAGGPKKLWSRPVGGGYSGPVVAGGKVYVTDRVAAAAQADPKDPFDAKTVTPSKERVLTFDAKTGEPGWSHEYDCPYQVSYRAGPRCAPLVDGGRVYTLGAMGHLFCLDAEKGTVVWKKHFPTDLGAKVQTWGFAGHPLVYKDLLVCLVGGPKGSLVAFDKATGAERWAALPTADAGYGTPALISAGGTTQLVIWLPRKVAGLDPATGKQYWSVPLEPKYDMSIMAPRQHGDYLFAGGIGGAVVVKLAADKPAAEEVWRGAKNTGVYPVNMTPVIADGVIYGVDQPGQFRAVKLATGERLWATFKPVLGEEKEEGFQGGGSGTAFVVKNGDRYFIFNEVGELIIARLSPGGYEEIDKAKLLDPSQVVFGRKVVWSHPAFANGCVFVRNDNTLACFSLAKE